MVGRLYQLKLAILLGLVLVAPSALAAVSAQLSASSIDELDTVTLSIKITNTRQTQNLDLDELRKDFQILNTNTMSQSRFIQGRGTSWVDYQITLQPLRVGNLTIPSINIGGEATPTLSLEVRPLAASTRSIINERVFFEQDLSSDEIYVQSQLVITRRLLYSEGVQLYNELPTEPEIEDAVVLTLGETVSGTTQRNGRTYGVVQQRYAIFPELSGTLTIPAISVTASVSLTENGRTSRKGVRVGTQTQTVTVLPVPPSYPTDQPWLPAENVRLLSLLSPSQTQHDVGDTLTHELLIHIDGNLGTASPPLPLDLDDQAFRSYPSAPTMQDDTNAATVKGSRLQTSSIVPQQPGRLTIPGNELVWWNTITKSVERTQTEAITINVEGTPVTTDNVAEQADSVTAPAPDTEEITAPLTEAATTLKSPWVKISGVLIAVLGVIGLFLALRKPRKSTPSTDNRKHHDAPQQANQRLKNAMTSRDLKAVSRSAHEILAAHYRSHSSQALAQFRLAHPDAALVLEEIDRHVYGPNSNSEQARQGQEKWNNKLSQLASGIAQLDKTRQQQKPRTELPDLYPNAF